MSYYRDLFLLLRINPSPGLNKFKLINEYNKLKTTTIFLIESEPCFVFKRRSNPEGTIDGPIRYINR